MVHLHPGIRQEIERHGTETYPHECCGFLIGQPGEARRVGRIHRLVNQRTDRARDRYEIDPLDWVRVERGLSDGEQVVGVYHSHPDHPSRPSEFDREHAHPHMSYIIVAVHQGEVESMQSWVLHPQTRVFEEENIGEAS
jgi:proteasome lid subunit RPN8/RPN11